MGKSAKLTRGGNKKRVNVGRQEAKLKAQGGKQHTASKDALKAPAESAKKSVESVKKVISETLKQQKGSIVKMAPKPQKDKKPAASENEDEQS